MNADELFSALEVASESPKLKWLRAQNAETEHFPEGGFESPETGDYVPKWVCRKKKESGSFGPREIGCGETEQEAIADFAINAGVRLWFETPDSP